MIDEFLGMLRRPNRIDPAAEVSPLAQVTESSLHGQVVVGDHARIHRCELVGPLRIGRHSSLWGPEIYVLARVHPVQIGNFCSIARHVSVHGFSHDTRRISTHYIGRNVLGLPIEDEIVSKGPTRIGHDVWIGAGVHVMSGVSIGNGAVIGAGSIVTRDVAPYAIAVGSPAEVVRYRFDPGIIDRIEALEWWEWSVEEIRQKQELFTGPVTEDRLDRWT